MACAAGAPETTLGTSAIINAADILPSFDRVAGPLIASGPR